MNVSQFAVLLCLFLVFCPVSGFTNERSFNNYIPKSHVYLINSINKQVACANEALKSANITQTKNIAVGLLQNSSNNDNVPNGLTGIFTSALFEITQESKVQVVNMGFFLPNHLTYTTQAAQKSNWDNIVIGQTSGFDKGIAGKGRTGGLFSKYFGLGIADLSNQSLLQMDFLLLDKQGIVVASASMATILEYLDNSTDSEITDENSGFYFSWSDDVGESITLAQRIISSQAALIFLEKITELNLKCETKHVFPNSRKHNLYENAAIETIEVSYDQAFFPKKSKRFYFPRSYRSSLVCSKKVGYNCSFKFKRKLNKEILVYVEDAFINAFHDDARVDVSCKAYKGELSCFATGQLTSFSERKFKKNLYG
ncbi:hypothetical protein Q4493_14860 [Colwellia sp. 1_MG-2023]|uniref:hypothetical protein n=1 Tax=Colwellia sp. 1_MG-2023 TaxID=3062649 RepID=UPI0026E1AE4E|nr:hypothetical protein [Colwellia sp. 1_MG-2023]MDO6447049.1 hypothetical protein [Colwellia sp. 1_MG-2023]